MENLASNTLLTKCFGVYAVLSFTLTSCMVYDSNWAWLRMFCVTNENKHSAASICYTSALLGEGSLQWMAFLIPQHYAAACLAYMIPYKLTSVFLLLKESTTQANKPQADALRFVAFNYFAAAGILVACCFVGGKQ